MGPCPRKACDRSALRVPTGYTAPIDYGFATRLLAIIHYWSRQNPFQFQLPFPNCPAILSSEYLSVYLGDSSGLRYVGNCMAFLPCRCWEHTSFIASCSSLTACVLHLEGNILVIGICCKCLWGCLLYSCPACFYLRIQERSKSVVLPWC